MFLETFFITLTINFESKYFFLEIFKMNNLLLKELLKVLFLGNFNGIYYYEN